MFILDVFDCTTDEKLKTIVQVIKATIQVVQILVPMGLIIMGTIDFLKAVVAQNEENIKKNQMVFIKRVIAAVIVFTVVAIVMALTEFLGNDQWKECWVYNSTSEIPSNILNT